jgi:hypothetical protein
MINSFKLIKVKIIQTQFNPDAVDTEIYVYNSSEKTIELKIKNSSFITIDEENGNTAGPSSDFVLIKIKPNSFAIIAEIQGWEWDGFVGLEITDVKTGKEFCYNLKNAGKPFKNDQIEGNEIKPL